MTNNIVWKKHKVTKRRRSELKNQIPCILWFTGLSGAGKSTIADFLEEKITQNGGHAYLLDGDNVRHGLCGDLGFSNQDRVENIRRVGEVANLFVDAGIIVIAAFISPFRADREKVRELVQASEFLEIFIDTPLDECERRDPKGFYAKARRGEIKNFTGIDSIYEAPESADIRINTVAMTAVEAADSIFSHLRLKGYL